MADRVIKSRKRKRSPPASKFEIIYPSAQSDENFLPAIAERLKSVLEHSRYALGEIYAYTAQKVLEHKEAIEDRRAEQRLEILRTAGRAHRARAGAETRLIENGARRNRVPKQG